MPTLADIYSAADSFKRRLSDFARNPGTSIQNMVAEGINRAQAFNQLTREAGQEKELFGPKTRQLGETIAEGYNPAGMVVFHGSPHIFEKFDLSKIGTGEGAQSYGRGLYMAQSPQVAKNYQEATSKDRFITKNGFFDPGEIEHLNVRAAVRTGDLDKAIALAKKYGAPDADYPETAAKAARDLMKLESVKASGGMSQNPGAFYKVDLPDTHIRRMLDWDEPLSNQPKQVRQLAKSLGMDMNDLGGDLLAKVGKDEAGKQMLEKAGIRGIKYLDERSRMSPYQVDISVKGKPYASSQFATKEQAERYAAEKQAEGFQTSNRMVGTRNFVVFDPNHLTILERNAQPVR